MSKLQILDNYNTATVAAATAQAIVPEVDYGGDAPTVSGRSLHAALEVKTEYRHWFPRMCEYGFTEGEDFNPVKIDRIQEEGGRFVSRAITDHQLTVDMAKQLCMLQRSEKGMQFRKYFIEIERRWNNPEAIMARALQIANGKVEALQAANEEMKPKAEYYDLAMSSGATMNATELAASLGLRSAQKLNRLLCSMGIQRQAKNGNYYVLTAKYADKGYAVLNQKAYGAYGMTMQLRFTQKGREFIYHLLVDGGVIEPDVVPQASALITDGGMMMPNAEVAQ